MQPLQKLHAMQKRQEQTVRQLIDAVLQVVAMTGSQAQRDDAAAVSALLLSASLPSELQPEAANFARTEEPRR